MRRFTTIALSLLTLVAGACSGVVPPAGAAGLSEFDSCTAYLEYVKAEALNRVGPYGFGSALRDAGDLAFEEGDAAAATPSGAADAATESSRTNVQEAGIDEPDIVKTDGKTIYAVAGSTLHAVDATGDAPRVVGSLDLGSSAAELLTGDDVLVAIVSSHDAGIPEDDVAARTPGGATSFIFVDISAPAELEVDKTTVVGGQYVDARVVESDAADAARIVLRSEPPELDFAWPGGEDTPTEAWAEAYNRRVIAESTLDDWLPSAVDAGGEARPLVDCSRIMRPGAFSGFGLSSVLTVSIEPGGEITDSVALAADADTVYASATSLYIASNTVHDRESTSRPTLESGPDRFVTEIHRFDISSESASAYVASGEVPGELLNQFSMSEHNGVLRVASTGIDVAGFENRESYVTTLRSEADRLVEVGRVGGLGRGERIYSVRFMGDTGYVVTFRETDPLYTIDLSDPAEPAVRGELEIEGYSAYLHPVGDGRLLGVGQDATREGRRLDTQVSLFDVSDPANPHRVAQWTPGEDRWSDSEVEYDHHAFTFWEPTGTAVLPLSTPDGTQVAALDVAADAIAERAMIAHPGSARCERYPIDVDAGDDVPGVAAEPYCYEIGPQIRRSLVVDNRLFTVSDEGVMAHDLASLAELGWAPFEA